jgi:hypothetical protein
MRAVGMRSTDGQRLPEPSAQQPALLKPSGDVL